MKIVQIKNSKYKNKEYFKYLVFLPSKIMKSFKWKKGDELETEIKEDKLIISKKKK